MKKLLTTLATAATLLSAASAQTVINGVVISRPGQQPVQIHVVPKSTTRVVVPTRVTPAPVRQTVTTTTITTMPAAPAPAPVVKSTVTTTPGTRTVPAFVDSAVPADWIDIRGRVSMGAGRTRLPDGSQVNVRLVDLNNGRSTLLNANFTTRFLPTSYQLVSNPRRFAPGGRYAVQAIISNNGSTLYRSRLYSIDPKAKRILADLEVR